MFVGERICLVKDNKVRRKFGGVLGFWLVGFKIIGGVKVCQERRWGSFFVYFLK